MPNPNPSDRLSSSSPTVSARADHSCSIPEGQTPANPRRCPPPRRSTYLRSSRSSNSPGRPDPWLVILRGCPPHGLDLGWVSRRVIRLRWSVSLPRRISYTNALFHFVIGSPCWILGLSLCPPRSTLVCILTLSSLYTIQRFTSSMFPRLGHIPARWRARSTFFA
jgi:hypothetical protein